MRSLYDKTRSIYNASDYAKTREGEIKKIVEDVVGKFGRAGLSDLIEVATKRQERGHGVHTAKRNKRHGVSAGRAMRV